MDNVIVRYIDLPTKVGAVVVMDDDGDFNVYINALLPDEAQKESYMHELEHINRDHFYQKEKPVSVCEAEASKKKRKSGEKK